LKDLPIPYLANERSVQKEQDRNTCISPSPEILKTSKPNTKFGKYGLLMLCGKRWLLIRMSGLLQKRCCWGSSCTFSACWSPVPQIQHVTSETPETPLPTPVTTAWKLLSLLGSFNRQKCFSRKYSLYCCCTFITKTFCSALTSPHTPPLFSPFCRV